MLEVNPENAATYEFTPDTTKTTPAKPTPDWSEKARVTLESEGMMFSREANESRKFLNTKFDLTYNPEQDKDVPDRFKPYMTDARNREHAAAIVRDLQREESNRKVMDATPWYEQLVLSAAGQILDPMNLATNIATLGAGVGIRGATKLGQMARGAALTGTEAAAAQAVQEAALLNSQHLRTPREATFNVLATGAVGGLLGGVRGALTKTEIDAGVRELTDLQRRLDNPQPMQTAVDDAIRESMGAAFVQRQRPSSPLSTHANGPTQGRADVDLAPAPLFGKAGGPDLSTHVVKGEQTGSTNIVSKLTENAAAQEVMMGPFRKLKEIILKAVDTPYYVEGHGKAYANPHSIELGKKRALGDVADLAVDVEETYNKIRGKDFIGSFGEFRRELGRLLHRGAQSSSSEINRLVQRTRAMYDKFRAEGRAAGTVADDAEDIQNYMNSVVSKSAVESNYQQVYDLFYQAFRSQNPSMSAPDLAKLVSNTIDNWKGDSAKLTSSTKQAAPGNVFKERQLTIDRVLLEPYLETDVIKLLEKYASDTSTRNGMMRQFGVTAIDDIPELKAAQDELHALRQTDPQKAADLQAEFNRLKDMTVYILQKVNGIEPVKEGPFSGLGTKLVLITSASRLGMTLLANLPELATLAIRRNVGDVFQYMAKYATDSGYRKFSKEQRVQLGVGADLTLGQRMTFQFDVMDDFIPKDQIEKGLLWINQKMYDINLMNYMIGTSKTLAGNMAVDKVLERIVRLKTSRDAAALMKDAKLLATDNRELNRLGIGETWIDRIYDQWQQHGQMIEGQYRHPNLHLWTDREAADWFKESIIREVDSVVQTNFVGSQPMMYEQLAGSKVLAKMIFQFTRFMYLTWQQVVLSGLQGDAGRFYAVAMSTLFLTYLAQGTRSLVLNRTDDVTDFKQWTYNTFNNFSVLSLGTRWTQLADKLQYGPAQLLGLKETEKKRQQTRLGQVGPAFDYAVKAGDLAMTALPGGADWKGQDTFTFLSLMPLNNVFGIQQMTHALGDMFNEAYGLETWDTLEAKKKAKEAKKKAKLSAVEETPSGPSGFSLRK